METKYNKWKYIAGTFNPFDIYAAVFGYRALPFPQGQLNNLVPDVDEKISKLGAVLYKKDSKGREAFCPITLTRVQNGKIVKKYELPYSTVAIQLRKNIVKTALPGRRGSVKELIQIEDYQFTINGVILTDSELPESELMDINELFNINEPLKLENAFTDIFLQADNSVIIESIDLPDMKGISGAQAYSITISSDTILELENV